MHVLLVGPRGDSDHARLVQSRLALLASRAAEAGETVTLLGTVRTSAPVSSASLRVIEVLSLVPPFRRVEAQLVDVPLERALATLIRREPPDVVHVDGFGGSTSYLVPWLSDRLGVPAVVVAAPIEMVLCHRGTLIDYERRNCTVFDDPDRCARCCRAADDGGLSVAQSLLATLCRPLRGLSPFPHPTAFANRLDMIAQGLGAARIVCVADTSARDALVELGISERILRVGLPGGELSAARELWQMATAR